MNISTQVVGTDACLLARLKFFRLCRERERERERERFIVETSVKYREANKGTQRVIDIFLGTLFLLKRSTNSLAESFYICLLL